MLIYLLALIPYLKCRNVEKEGRTYSRRFSSALGAGVGGRHLLLDARC